MTAYDALAGISTMRFTSFLITGCSFVGPPADSSESSKVEWIAADDIPQLASAGRISDGPSLTALCYYLAVHRGLASSTPPA